MQWIIKHLTLFTFLFFFSSVCAQELTDYHIGDHFDQENDMIRLSVGGIEGTLFIYTDRKKKIKSLGFVPTLDGRNPLRIYQQEFKNLIYHLQAEYNTTFERTFERARKKQHYTARIKEAKIVITLDDFTDRHSSTRLTMMINKIED
ncbi:hypothetical protein [Flammeovirga pacifica]|uniref:Uncharacterized protein n=1 Tax=Flammeovirga pacifica TaxID=915059 RepID=A0A1S1YZ51_FLAPC|nr:hypothetical protein [Flammeovirga pacifica]OHX66291.1 hypothetical protein NH26_07950 [Flammeovirga pacifica]